MIFDKTCYDLNFTPLFIGKILSNVYSNWDMEKYHMYLDQFELPKKKKLKEFSKGMKMKMEFAAALSHDPKLLILDEATSSIDSRTEKIVQDGMDKLMEGRTVFVIAHRLSTIRNSDVIMVMDQGKIIERGNHEKLMRERGTYYQLYTGGLELD